MNCCANQPLPSRLGLPPTLRTSLPRLTHLRLADTRCIWRRGLVLLAAVACPSLNYLVVEKTKQGVPTGALGWQGRGFDQVGSQLEGFEPADRHYRLSLGILHLASVFESLRRLHVTAGSLLHLPALLERVLNHLPHRLATFETDPAWHVGAFAEAVRLSLGADHSGVRDHRLLRFWGV